MEGKCIAIYCLGFSSLTPNSVASPSSGDAATSIAMAREESSPVGKKDRVAVNTLALVSYVYTTPSLLVHTA